MANINNVAKEAGVSTATVSRVINNKKYVATKTHEKVMSVIEKLDYKPLYSAINLATKRTGNIGFIVWGEHFSEIEKFYSQIFLGMEYSARDSDYYILLTTVKEKFNPKEDLPRFLKYKDVDGVALAGRVPTSLIEYLENQGIPFILIDYSIPNKVCNSVVMDNYNGAFQAVDQIVKSGKKNIGFIGGSYFHPSVKDRYRGYKDNLKFNGLGDSEYFDKFSFLKNVETSPEIGIQGVKHLLSQNIGLDAIFCCNDTTAMGALSELKKYNIKVPKEVSVVGFDDITLSSFCTPSLSTVRVPKLEIGKESYRLLTEIIANPDSTPQTSIIDVEYIQRRSS